MTISIVNGQNSDINKNSNNTNIYMAHSVNVKSWISALSIHKVGEDGSRNNCLTKYMGFKAVFEGFKCRESYFEGQTVACFKCKLTKESFAKWPTMC